MSKDLPWRRLAEPDPDGTTERDQRWVVGVSGFSSFVDLVSSALRGKLDALRSAVVRGVEAHRPTRSVLERILYEMQHPKQVLYESPADVVIGAGATFLCPVVDIHGFRWVGYYIANTGGANPISTENLQFGEDPTGVGWRTTANGAALAIAPGAVAFSASGIPVIGGWLPTSTTWALGGYLRAWATSALGTTGRILVVAMR